MAPERWSDRAPRDDTTPEAEFRERLASLEEMVEHIARHLFGTPRPRKEPANE